MLFELCEALLTPCPRFARNMGYLHEVVGIGHRYRRCRDDWQPHLEHSRRLIQQAAARCTMRRKAVVLGSGRLYDVPIEALASAFADVVLVDLVHPLNARWRTRRLANVHRLTADVTGVLVALEKVAFTGGTLPVSLPTLFVGDPDVDLVVSLNLLSQLPIIPCRYLRRWNQFSDDAIDRFGLQLMHAHMHYLGGFKCTKCVIADVAYFTVDAEERVVTEEDALRGVSFPCVGEAWTWRLAPREGRGKHGYYHRVRGAIWSETRGPR